MLTGEILCMLFTKYFKHHLQLLKDSLKFKKTPPCKKEILFDRNILI